MPLELVVGLGLRATYGGPAAPFLFLPPLGMRSLVSENSVSCDLPRNV